MLDRIFPKTIDNLYRGHWLGLAIFVGVMALKALQSVMSIFNTRDTASNADGIPLASFPPAAVAEIVSMFALLGLYLLIVPLQSAVVLIRWRSLIPFLYVSLLTLQLSSRALIYFTTPATQSGHPFGFYVNMAILALTALGFVLSITGKGYSAAKAS